MQRDFRRVLRVRTAIPGESVLVFMGEVSIEKKPYKRAVPKLNYEKQFFANIEVCEVAVEEKKLQETF